MNNVTVCIKAFIRLAPLERALESLVGKGFAQVIVADDSHMDEDRRALYAKFRDRLPLRVLELPFRTGVSYGRNRMVEACTTPYLLLMDDDHFLTKDVPPMLEILESNPNFAAVSAVSTVDGKEYSGGGNLYCFGPFLVHDIGFGPHRRMKTSPAGNRYYLYDMVSNFSMHRTQAFNDVQWDEEILTAREHMDFYLTHQALGKWQFALAADCRFGHDGTDAAEVAELYKKYRLDRQTIKGLNDYFRKKWGLRAEAIWGKSHIGTGRGIKAGLIHALVYIGLRFRLDRGATSS